MTASNIKCEWKEFPATPAQLVTKACDEVVGKLKNNPGRSALVETSPSKQASKKWRSRGCIVSAFPSETVEGQYDIYAKWPHPDDRL